MGSENVSTANIRTLIKNNIRNYSMVLMLAVIMIAFAFMTNGVNLNSRNFTNIFIQNSYILLLAVGMVQVIIIGNIDLSVGRVAAFIGAISAMLYNAGIGMPATIIVSVVIGLGVGMFQGFWIAFLKIPAFIVTLAGMLLFRGLTYIITNVTPISLKDDGFKWLASGLVNIPGLEINGVYYTAILIGAVIFALYVMAEIISRRNKIKNSFEVSSIGVFVFKLAVIGLLIMG
jgi:putative multiple sugar transport system permease protein